MWSGAAESEVRTSVKLSASFFDYASQNMMLHIEVPSHFISVLKRPVSSIYLPFHIPVMVP